MSRLLFPKYLTALFFACIFCGFFSSVSATVRVKVVTTVSEDPNDLIASPVYGVAVKVGSVSAIPTQESPARIVVNAGSVVIKVDTKFLVDANGRLYRVGSVAVSPTKTGVVSLCAPTTREGNITVDLSESQKNPSSLSDYEIGVRFVPLDAPKLKNPSCKISKPHSCKKKARSARFNRQLFPGMPVAGAEVCPPTPKEGTYAAAIKSNNGLHGLFLFKLKDKIVAFALKGTLTMFDKNNKKMDVIKVQGGFLADTNLFTAQLSVKLPSNTQATVIGDMAGKYDAKHERFVLRFSNLIDAGLVYPASKNAFVAKFLRP